jgi:RNA 2',3'-cyclic 3'-phosphodiesterase
VRSFLAMEIPGNIKEYLQDVIRTMAARTGGVKWVRPEGQHITLKFFGEIDEGTALQIREALSPVETYEPFTASLGRVDAFPGRKSARVIVAVLEKGVDNIRRIFNDIEHGLSTLGIEREKRDLTPHITLGRRKVPAPLLEREIAKLEEKTFLLDKLVLFKSTLTPGGAVYEPVWEIRLKEVDR